MATERIKITPSSFVVKDAAGNTNFDSDRFYLKSDASGNLKVGGYNRSPVIAGTVTASANTITDSTGYGGFPVFILTASNTAYTSISFNVPKFNYISIGNMIPTRPLGAKKISSSLPVYLNGSIVGYCRLYTAIVLQPITNGYTPVGATAHFLPNIAFGTAYNPLNNTTSPGNLIEDIGTGYLQGTVTIDISNYSLYLLDYSWELYSSGNSSVNITGAAIAGSTFSVIQNPATLSLAVTS